jgi:hypothetical protein
MKRSFFLSLLTTLAAPLAFAFPSFDTFTSAVGSGNGTAYADGAFLYHQTNAFGDGWAKWNNTGGGANANYGVDCTNIGLSYSGFPANFPAPPAANSVWLPGSALLGSTQQGEEAALQFPPILADPNNLATNKVYASFLMQISNLGNLTNNSPIYWGGFATNQGDQSLNGIPSSALKLFVKASGSPTTAWSLGVANNSGSGSAVYDSGGHGTGTVIFVVVDYEFGINSNADVANLWVNPAASAFGRAAVPTATGTINITGANRIGDAADFYLLCRQGASLWGSMYLADLRVGKSWAFVTGGPDITNAPAASVTNALNTTATLAVGAISSGGTLSYQWQQNGFNLTDSSTIAGSTSSVLTITNVNSTNAGAYAVIVSTPVGSVTNSINLVVLDPQITVQPPATVDEVSGSSVTFSVTAAGSAPLTYQWTESGSPLVNGPTGSGSAISGAKSGSLTISNLSASDSGAYAVIVSNEFGASVTSSNVVLTVSDPVIINPPPPETVNYQGTASFTVAAAGSGPFTYQWLVNGSPLANGPDPLGSGATVSGATNQTLSLAGVTYVDSGSGYSATVYNHLGNYVTSSSATLTVNDPYIVSQPSPAAQFKQTGGATSIRVVANGSPSVSYQWNQGATALTDGTTGSTAISGSQSSTLTISGVTSNDTGSYDVVISGPGGSAFNVTSAAAVLTVQDPVAITTPPRSLADRVGEHVGFVAVAAGTSPGYQWEFDDAPIVGATNSALSVANIQSTNAGTYKIVVTNLVSGPASASATLTVINSPWLALAATNLLVARVGDGVQTLSGTAGNTLYFDQYTTNGTYLNSSQAPDEGIGQPYGTGGNFSSSMPLGSPALIVAGAGNDGDYEAMLTLSGADQEYLGFAGYCLPYPATGGPVNDAAGNWRGLATMNAFGYYTLAYTNSGLYNAGSEFIRGMVTLDGLNFWCVGSAGSGTVKFVNSTNASYADGSGIPASTGLSAAGGQTIQIVNGPLPGFSSLSNLVVSEIGQTNNNGLYAASGTPEPGYAGAIAFSPLLYTGSSGSDYAQPQDFAFSPDNKTLYVADARAFTSDTDNTSGGIQRWDANTNNSFTYNYTLPPLTGATNGAQGLTVDFSAARTWGSNVFGAKIYATTYGASGNSLISIVDNGSSSASTVLASAGPNQAFRGLRFGPALVPPGFATQPKSVVARAGPPATLSAVAVGSGPLSCQWFFQAGGAGAFSPIAAATNASYAVASVSAGNVGNYYLMVTNPVGTMAQSQTASLSLALPPRFTAETYLGAGAGLRLSYTGPASEAYSLWTTTNFTLRPITNTWAKLTNGTFSGGTDTALDATAGSVPARYYILTVP